MPEENEIYDLALKIIGNRLREIRHDKGYTNYEKYAFAHDLNRSKYGKYENGSNMQLTTLLKILIKADIHPNDLFNDIWDDIIALSETEG